MRKLFVLLLALNVASCGSFRKGSKMKPRDGVVYYAKGYLGTPYALGGNTKGGIDCSGLIYNAYRQQSQCRASIKTNNLIIFSQGLWKQQLSQRIFKVWWQLGA